ncbi:hypothetical protein [Jannaschia aquimarina]|uniref:Lipoprotein n=1 Tax=Jannaschia aquimarina TaxID=935700 RepID=A0A0D1CM83_9RHOB|nr:hypothetical protein [Jannaschia aquimarina]KIT15857.1 hypothetical protein jaqu_24370 [Jannaschia aquimarina]SNT10155.1 hypothetical protein SAMN05421775_105253 [Jannaschia aquimarina]
MKLRLTLAATLLTFVAACSTEQVVDNTVDTTFWTGKTVVKTGIGAGKLAVKGGHAIATRGE